MLTVIFLTRQFWGIRQYAENDTHTVLLIQWLPHTNQDGSTIYPYITCQIAFAFQWMIVCFLIVNKLIPLFFSFYAVHCQYDSADLWWKTPKQIIIIIYNNCVDEISARFSSLNYCNSYIHYVEIKVIYFLFLLFPLSFLKYWHHLLRNRPLSWVSIKWIYI